MRYTKPALTYEQQADLLLSRGLLANRDSLIVRLKAVNYYRLSGYIYPFRESDGQLKAGTTLDRVWHYYIFDRKLRMLVMDAIERVEVALRTNMAYEFAHRIGTFEYRKRKHFPQMGRLNHWRWLHELREEMDKSPEFSIQHYREKYSDEKYLPVWMLVETMSLGKLLTFYRYVRSDVRKQIADMYDVPDPVFESWVRTLNGVRNICAHHGRLWNRKLGYRPKLPSERKRPDWQLYRAVDRGKIFMTLSILQFLLQRCATTSSWGNRIVLLIRENQDLPISSMGFPRDWDVMPFWNVLDPRP